MTSRRIAVVTGTRAEFGLLRTVMDAVQNHPSLDLQALVTGAHLLEPARTVDEVAAAFDIAATIPMQHPGESSRVADAAALGRGIEGFAMQFAGSEKPDVVLVLGDRIEAFAAAAAAAVSGIRVAHLHGGDRAEGIADDSIRHAITKLAHIHLPATQQSAERIIRMGENPTTVHVVGSPAIDDLYRCTALSDEQFAQFGSPELVLLMHPIGRDDSIEARDMEMIIRTCTQVGPTLALHPNHDPGRDGILQALAAASDSIVAVPHLPREMFIGLLRRVSAIVGNSSGGLIECASLGVPCVNLGTRQDGREKSDNVIDVPTLSERSLRDALDRARMMRCTRFHPYGEGRAGVRTAETLSMFSADNHPLSKRNTY